jgi:hypothetical protein
MKNVLQKLAQDPAADPTIVFRSKSWFPVAPAAIPRVKYLKLRDIDRLHITAAK